MRLERLTINFFLTVNTTITHVIVQYIYIPPGKWETSLLSPYHNSIAYHHKHNYLSNK